MPSKALLCERSRQRLDLAGGMVRDHPELRIKKAAKFIHVEEECMWLEIRFKNDPQVRRKRDV